MNTFSIIVFPFLYENFLKLRNFFKKSSKNFSRRHQKREKISSFSAVAGCVRAFEQRR
jgi:hypothetical protein